jgi:hypothetical protein
MRGGSAPLRLGQWLVTGALGSELPPSLYSSSGRNAARSHLFERISGLPAELMPSETTVRGAESRKWISEFTTQLTSDLATELDHTAKAFLDRRRIHDEPLTWQPDTTLPGTPRSPPRAFARVRPSTTPVAQPCREPSPGISR